MPAHANLVAGREGAVTVIHVERVRLARAVKKMAVAQEARAPEMPEIRKGAWVEERLARSVQMEVSAVVGRIEDVGRARWVLKMRQKSAICLGIGSQGEVNLMHLTCAGNALGLLAGAGERW